MRHLLLSLLLLISPWVAADQDAPSDDSFESLLVEGELQFDPPEGYLDLPAGRTLVLDYERALRSPDGRLEIRIAVRPLKRLVIDYDDPHGAVPNPNHIFPLVFESLATRLSGGRHAPSNEYPPDSAREKFNADWAAAAVFDTVTEFDTSHKQGLLVAMHRNKVSDAYVVFLFDDYATVKESLNGAMKTLVFVPAAEGDTLPKTATPIHNTQAPTMSDSPVRELGEAEGRFSVADVFAKAPELAGKTIEVKGKVVKISHNIMARNWVHIQDGSGEGPTSKIVFRTIQEDVAVGDEVVAKGVVELDKSFGSNYYYPVIVEDSVFTK